MLRGIMEGQKPIAIASIATALAGAIFGVLMGALTDNYLLWIGIMLFIGANVGVAIGYGFLPDK